MKSTFIVTSFSLLSIFAAACSSGTVTAPTPAADGGTASTPPATSPSPTEPTCGGTTASLVPRGSTSDDTMPDSTKEGPFEMFVYSTSIGAVPSASAACPSAGAAAHGTSSTTLPTGDYYLCHDAGGCSCIAATLKGGVADFVWSAGPGGGMLSVDGCAALTPASSH